ncbi:histidine phosphatase family protein [Sporosalibacterium faouarense]|uniref:histidine phosphatase family protein n=1 Tax=Sporosalibacterium faouarense TaxID=516123 RepID=UPI00141CBD2E|nr:histidine phosphatase family protein [Sporosalibacterium faouarense]MTI46582.1 histidine phosphatase family protein [Bacillota bacterium]
MKLIMVRHGETEANKKGIYGGWSDYKLTEKGKTQAEDIIHFLIKEAKDIGEILCSPSDRTLYIANKLGNKLNKNISIKEELRELNFGLFEGKTNAEIKEQYGSEYSAWINDYVNYKIPKGESVSDLNNRLNKFLSQLKNRSGTYVIVSHGGVIQILITILLGLDIKTMWNFKVPPGGMVEIEYNNGFGILTGLKSV